jgi:colicin import membrane protein
MKNWIATSLLMACFAAQAQINSDAERLRISAERARLETAFTLEDSACYKRFLVNHCLDEVKVRRREALADLRRQEIVLNDEARKARAAEQIQKTENKSAPEKLQEEADKRAQTVKDFDERMAREKQKTADRDALQAGEKAKAEASAGRLKGNQDKEAGRTAKQAAAAEEQQKYNERQAQAKERQARNARDKASQAKAPAKPLPVPQ